MCGDGRIAARVVSIDALRQRLDEEVGSQVQEEGHGIAGDAAPIGWRAAAQRTVDDAEMKYVVVHLHRLLEPDTGH